MKTITINTYKFEELPIEVQNSLIAKEVALRNENVELSCFVDYCIEQATEKGFVGACDVCYSLSYSQGDGLCFSFTDYSKTLEVLKEITKSDFKATVINEYIANIYSKGNNGRYAYASKSDVDYSENYSVSHELTNVWEVIAKAVDIISIRYVALCKEFENVGYSDIEEQTSEETAKLYLIEEDLDYLENGTEI